MVAWCVWRLTVCVAVCVAVCAAEPDVCSVRLQEGDDFVIVATDGLFQDMSSQEAVDYAAEYILHHRAQQADSSGSVNSRLDSAWSTWLPRFLRPAPAPAAASPGSLLSTVEWTSCSAFLVSRALLHASEKHIGRKHSEADNLQWIARLPIDERRAVHDDCTVVLVHLAHGHSGDGSRGGIAAVQPQSHIQSKL